MTSTNLRESVECWVLRIRKSADDLFVCSSCSIFCSMTANPISANVIIVNRTTKGQSNRYLSASIELYWPFSWCRPSDPRAPASPLQIKREIKFRSTDGIGTNGITIYLLSSVCGADRMALCFFLTSSTLACILSIFSRISFTCHPIKKDTANINDLIWVKSKSYKKWPPLLVAWLNVILIHPSPAGLFLYIP